MPPALLTTSTSGVPSGTVSTASLPASVAVAVSETPSPVIVTGLSRSAIHRNVTFIEPETVLARTAGPVLHRYEEPALRPGPPEPPGAGAFRPVRELLPEHLLGHVPAVHLDRDQPHAELARVVRTGVETLGAQPQRQEPGREHDLAGDHAEPLGPGAWNGASRLRSQSGSGTASLLSSTTYGVETVRRARLLPPAKPVFTGLAITRTSGKSRESSSSEPSREALSTTTVSNVPAGRSCRRSPSRQGGSRCAPL